MNPSLILVNPDLDLNTLFPKENPKKWLWWFMWWPYSRLIGHRSPISHWPIVGTIFRIMYIFIFWSIVSKLLAIDLETTYPVVYGMLIGLSVSDTIHIIMDYTSTALKWAKRRKS